MQCSPPPDVQIESSDEETEVNQITSSSQVSPKSSKQRIANWDWDDTVALITLVHKHGKGNWELILQKLHNEQHHCVKITDADKLRTHFNTVNGKNGMHKEYKTPPIHHNKKHSEEENNAAFVAFSELHQLQQKECDHCVQLLDEIEA